MPLKWFRIPPRGSQFSGAVLSTAGIAAGRLFCYLNHVLKFPAATSLSQKVAESLMEIRLLNRGLIKNLASCEIDFPGTINLVG